MAKAGTSTFQRRFLLASVILGIFIVLEIALFGWLIVDSLSKREMDRILLATRKDASEVAGQLEREVAGKDRDMFTAIATSKETTSYIEDVLLQRDLVETVEVTNSDGVVVYRKQSQTTIPNPARPGSLEAQIEGDPKPRIEHRIQRQASSTTSLPMVEEKIGDVATLRIGFNQVELARRVAELRSELVQRTMLIGSMTLVVLFSAYLAIGFLLLRARRLEEQARESERMAYVGTLAAGLAHEIRNPLNSLSLNMQLLEEEIAEARQTDSSSQRLLSITRSEIDRLGRLATDFLSYARNRPLERDEVPAVELLERACQGMAGELRNRQVDVVVRDAASGASVRVDPGQLQQLLINLVSNALAATEDSGRPPRITLTAERLANRVVLEVRDNGVGMPPEERDKMFDIFYSTRKGGTGLGLAIVDRIAKAHEAEIEVESEVGVGTAVRVVLPEAGAAVE
ncbi:MAG: GHKL domain-containing protein [Acidobacteria bacterium]|nr:GHKL domain-containing protein [Acidobacteriota bacterium]